METNGTENRECDRGEEKLFLKHTEKGSFISNSSNDFIKKGGNMLKKEKNIERPENGRTHYKGGCLVYKMDYVIHSNVAKRDENWAHILTEEWIRLFKDSVYKEMGSVENQEKFFEKCKKYMRDFLSGVAKSGNDNPFILITQSDGFNILIEMQNNKLIFEIWYE